MSSAYKLTIPEDFPLSDEDPMESDLELTPTPRKPPGTEWWLCWDLLEMVGKEVLAVRKRNTIQYWQDITAQKDYSALDGDWNTGSKRTTFIINYRLTLKSIDRYIIAGLHDNQETYVCPYRGIKHHASAINYHQPQYKPRVIKSYPKRRAKKNRCSVCRRVGHNKRNCPRVRKS